MGSGQAIGLCVVALAVVGIALLIVVVVRDSRRKRDALILWCERTDWEYTQKENYLGEQWQMPPFDGYGTATDVIRGSVPEGPILCMTHTRGTGDNTSQDRMIAAIDVGLQLPPCNIARRSPLARSLRLTAVPLPYPGWDAQADSPDSAERAARLFTPEVMAHLNQLYEDHTGVQLTLEGQQVILMASDRLTADKIDQLIEAARVIAAEIKKHPV